MDAGDLLFLDAYCNDHFVLALFFLAWGFWIHLLGSIAFPCKINRPGEF